MPFIGAINSSDIRLKNGVFVGVPTWLGGQDYIQQALDAFRVLNASVLMPGLSEPVGLLNLLPYSDASNPAWTFFNVSGTATRVGNVLTFGTSTIDRIIKTGGGLTITQGQQYTSAVKLSGSGTVRVFFVDGQGSTFLATTITLTSTPTYYSGVRTATATGSSGGLGVYGNGSPASLTVHETAIFAGDVSVAQIEANGGIPETQATAEAFVYKSSIPSLPYRTYLDSTFMDFMESVTQLDQPVGGVLDAMHSKPKVAQVLTNPDFDRNGEGWTVQNTDATHIVTFANSKMRFQSDTTSPVLQLSQLGRLTTFCMYRITGYVSALNDSHGTVTARLKSDALGGMPFAKDIGPFEVFAVATSTSFTMTRNTANVDVTLDWLKVEQVLPKAVGPNILTNGGFDTDTAWTKGTGWSIADGKASKVAGVEANLSQAIAGLEQGKLYEIGIKYSVQAGVLYVRFGSLTSNYGTFLVDGEQTLILKPNGNGTIYIYGNASFVGWVDDITVKEVLDTTGTNYATDSNSEVRAISVPLDTLTGFSAKERSSEFAHQGGYSTKLISIAGSRLHYWNIRTVPAGVGITVSGWVYAPAAIGQAIRAIDVADGSFIQQIAGSTDSNRWVYFQFTRPAKATQWTLALGQNSVGDWGTNAIYFDDLTINDAVGEIAVQATTANKPTARRGLVNRTLYSSDFSNAAWSKTNMTIAGTLATRGNTTGASYTGNSTLYSLPIGSKGTVVARVAAGTVGGFFGLRFQGTYPNKCDMLVNLATGAFTTSSSSFIVDGAEVIDDNGVWMCVMRFTVVSSLGARIYWGPTDSTVTTSSWEVTTSTLCNANVYSVCRFDGHVTAAEILAAGGIPLTTTTLASSALGKQHFEFDGANDLLSYGRATLQNTSDHWVTASFECGLSALSTQAQVIYGNSNTTTNVPLVCQLFVENAAAGATSRAICSAWRNNANVLVLLVGPNVPLGQRVVATTASIGGVGYLWYNGVLVASASLAGLGTTTVNTSTIGATVRNTTSSYFAGDIYHLSFGQSTLTEAERLKVEAFAAEQAGVTL